MNNAQFRKLLETPRPANTSNSQNAPSATPALGSKLRSSIPMTPRSVLGGSSTQSEFARQLAANNASEQKAKKFRSSAAPLGTRLPEGYVDRTKDRDDNDDRDRRLAALEELYKEGGIEHEEYVRQTKLLGGDVSSTHLVKGLDFKLLERVRGGEDVMRSIRDAGDDDEAGEGENSEDGDEDVLDKALEKEVVPEKKEERKKKGNLAPKTRVEILAELKRSKEAAKPVSVLGSKFKKIGVKEEKKEENGAKVKYVMGADGKVKKMVKKDKTKKKSDEPEPVSTSVMGMMPPPPMPGKAQEKKVEEEDEDIDIFEGAGTEYNPLAGMDSDSSSSSSSSEEEEGEEGEEGEIHPPKKSKSEKAPESSSNRPPPPPYPMPPPSSTPKPKINYFNEPTSSSSSSGTYQPPSSASALLSSNPELAAALTKASTLNAFSTPSEDEGEKRRKALTEAADRDAFDIDFGFGGSRDFGDEDDDDGTVAKSGGGKKRKRGGKPKKGDKNDAGVVGRIVEERYGGGSRK
ncbi:hypothetical protein L873DRAFT_1813720 [Choiromyces venosus 120613-1]|uniref:RED-like N-terminal domain-containing protein n=1 Tax=Choiromyces venosus 120613-1 TaxID=1336337 RepID=A0A3N4JC91_9PEZI|nr:hypothetical protein L873DRAFT_1813720 [Choiromyces venosus 120613-1]